MLLRNSEKKKAYSKRYYEKHKAEVRARNKAWALAHPERLKAYSKKHEAVKRNTKLQIKYGLSEAAYLLKFAEQKGLCAICEQPDERRALSIDHNHKNLQVRGLLCTRCNLLIGIAQENLKLLAASIEYLRKWNVE